MARWLLAHWQCAQLVIATGHLDEQLAVGRHQLPAQKGAAESLGAHEPLQLGTNARSVVEREGDLASRNRSTRTRHGDDPAPVSQPLPTIFSAERAGNGQQLPARGIRRHVSEYAPPACCRFGRPSSSDGYSAAVAGTGALFAGLAATDAVLAATRRHSARRLTKPLLMPTLMRGKPRSTQRALALGGLGDVALLGKGNAAFTAGLGSFLAGHVAWVTTLRSRSTGVLAENPFRALPYVGAWVGLNAYLWPKTGKDRIPVLVYSAALLATALAALDTGDKAVAAGGALFMVSDALLALEKFGDVHLPVHEGIVMATYTSGQALLARI